MHMKQTRRRTSCCCRRPLAHLHVRDVQTRTGEGEQKKKSAHLRTAGLSDTGDPRKEGGTKRKKGKAKAE